jgi:(+)-trans-carveol dehydrogenase
VLIQTLEGITFMSGAFDGKVALVTGAARGMGRNHALRLAENGARIIAVDLCEQIASVPYPMSTAVDLRQTVSDVQQAGAEIIAREVDVRDFDALDATIRSAVEHFGRLDVVCANAGISSTGRLPDLPAATWQDVIDVNLTGVWHTCKAAIPHMLAAGNGGSIVITSSGAGLRASQNIGHYVASKHGVVGLMRTLALELAADYIRVNTIHPATVQTPMIMNDMMYRLFRPDLAEPSAEDAEVGFRQLMAMPVPWVTPDDVTNVVLFLASEKARFITGVALPIDAGRQLR